MRHIPGSLMTHVQTPISVGKSIKVTKILPDTLDNFDNSRLIKIQFIDRKSVYLTWSELSEITHRCSEVINFGKKARKFTTDLAEGGVAFGVTESDGEYRFSFYQRDAHGNVSGFAFRAIDQLRALDVLLMLTSTQFDHEDESEDEL